MYVSSAGLRPLGKLFAGLTLSLLPFGSGGALFAAPAATTATSTTTKRASIQTLHDPIKSIDDARSMTVTDPTLGSLKVTLTARGRILRAGKTAPLTDFHAGDTITLRGRVLQAGQFSATMVMDEASVGLAALTRRSPVMKVSAVDTQTGQITLQSASGDVRVEVLPARVRMGRKEMGAATGAAVGQSYGVRIGVGPDGEPDVSLSNPTATTGRTRKPKGTVGVAPVGTP